MEEFKPTVLIGACGQSGMFTQPVLEAMSRLNERPIVFALSNPTSKAECTAEQAYAWTDGRVVFARGSPFDPVTVEGCVLSPGQANNSYFPPRSACVRWRWPSRLRLRLLPMSKGMRPSRGRRISTRKLSARCIRRSTRESERFLRA